MKTNENLLYSIGNSTQCPKWEGNLKKSGYMCMYSLFALLCSRNECNIVKLQLSSNKWLL